MRATAILGDSVRVVHPAEGTFDLSSGANLMDAIIGIITRHPMREAELRQALERRSPQQIGEALSELAAGEQAQVVERYGAQFWCGAAARYPDEVHSWRTASDKA
jgi:hypothetical protein